MVVSLVNDMLRDLDKQPVPRSPVKRLLSDDVSLEPKREGTFQFASFLPGLVAFLVVGGAVFFSLESKETVVDVVSTPQVIASLESELEQESPSEEDSARLLKSLLNAAKTDYYQDAIGVLNEQPQTAAEELDALPDSKPLRGESLQAQSGQISNARSLQSLEVAQAQAQALDIAELLRNARRALNLDRLTSPLADNAFDHYNKVLVIDAQNEEAKTGLNVIAERYVELAQEYALEGNTTRAGVLLRRASAVVPFHPAVVNFWPNINRYGYALSDGQEKNEVPLKTQDILQAGAVAAKPVSGVEGQVAAPKAVSVVRSTESLDRQVAREARALVAQGRSSSARLQLQAFVSDNPKALHSIRALFDLLLQVNAYADAKRLLARSSDLPSLELSKMTAYWFLAQDDLQGAGRAIDSQQANTQVDTSFLALKAGVLHKLERYQESAQTYKTLLQQDQTNSAYWLGLAVASDAMEDAGAALQAFKAAEPGQKNTDIRRYITTRISALSKRAITTGSKTQP